MKPPDAMPIASRRVASLCSGLAADLSFFIDFYGLALFAAGGLNNGGVNDGSGCFIYF